MVNGWTKWDKLECVVEVKVPPGSSAKVKDLIFQVEEALRAKFGANMAIPLPRSHSMSHLASKTRVLHLGKVIKAKGLTSTSKPVFRVAAGPK